MKYIIVIIILLWTHAHGVENVPSPFTHFKFNENGPQTVLTDHGVGAVGATVTTSTDAFSDYGKVGQSFNFDVDPNHSELSAMTNSIKTDTVGSFTFWAYPFSNKYLQPFVFGGTPYTEMISQIQPNGTFLFYITAKAGSTNLRPLNISFPNVILAKLWTHIAIVQDGSEIKVYANGRLLTPNINNYESPGAWLSYMSVDGPGVTGNIDNGVIGGYYNVGSFLLNSGGGKIDDFRYYRFPLNASEVSALYNCGFGTEATNPELNRKCDSDSGHN